MAEEETAVVSAYEYSRRIDTGKFEGGVYRFVVCERLDGWGWLWLGIGCSEEVSLKIVWLIKGLFGWLRCLCFVIANSGFLERPQKRSRGNQLIHRRLTKTKLIGSGQNPGSQAGRRLWWMVFGVEMGREIRGSGRTSIGFAKEQCFQFGVKEPWRDGKRRCLSEFVGWVRYIMSLYMAGVCSN